MTKSIFKYPKVPYRNRYRLKKAEDLTYILGARCKDGVVLVADRVVSRGSKYTYEDKLTRPFNDIVMGSAGTSGLFDQFLKRLDISVSKKKLKTIQDFLDEVSLQVSDVFEFNRKIIKNEDEKRGLYLEVLVGVQYSDGRKSELWHIYPNGYKELERKYTVIGQGENYGDLFVKTCWKESLNMFNIANLGCFIIRLIDHRRLDTSVGGKPHVFLIPDYPNPKKLKKISKHDKKDFEIRMIDARDKFERKLEKKVDRMIQFIKKLKLTNF